MDLKNWVKPHPPPPHSFLAHAHTHPLTNTLVEKTFAANETLDIEISAWFSLQ